MKNILLTIDGKTIKAPKGATVLEAARKAGIDIPTLCTHEELEPYGACRLCVVDIEGVRGFPTSCTTPAADNMTVKTDTPDRISSALIPDIRKFIQFNERGECIIRIISIILRKHRS